MFEYIFFSDTVFDFFFFFFTTFIIGFTLQLPVFIGVSVLHTVWDLFTVKCRSRMSNNTYQYGHYYIVACACRGRVVNVLYYLQYIPTTYLLGLKIYNINTIIRTKYGFITHVCFVSLLF